MPIIKEKYSHKEKMQSLNPATLEKRKLKKKSAGQVFFCALLVIYENSYSIKHLQTASKWNVLETEAAIQKCR